jgi:hypothetical protein
MFSLLLISLAMEVKPLYQSVILIITLRIHLLHYVMVQWILLALLALIAHLVMSGLILSTAMTG